MLVTDHPILARFWYPVMPMAMLTSGPRPFRLLGRDIVLWRDGEGAPVAMLDRCCHRTAKLSKGYTERGRLVCGYHGWEFDSTGRVVRVPQRAQPDAETRMGVERFHAAERYGHAWVALGEPLHPIPDFEESGASGFRQIDQFYEIWDCAGLRVMENSFDNAHFSFVHRASFGDQGHPQPAKLEIEPFNDGFLMTSQVPVKNPEIQKELLGMTESDTVRHMRARWYMPFLRKLRITYPNGLVHSIVTGATPIDDRRSQIVQFCFRNDTEADAPAEKVIAFDRQVTAEDKAILESTEWDVPLDQTGRELNMPSDRPGVVMRSMLRDLLAAHGERERGLAGTDLHQGSLDRHG